jgi:hypothetical protein
MANAPTANAPTASAPKALAPTAARPIVNCRRLLVCVIENYLSNILQMDAHDEIVSDCSKDRVDLSPPPPEPLNTVRQDSWIPPYRILTKDLAQHRLGQLQSLGLARLITGRAPTEANYVRCRKETPFPFVRGIY